MALKYRLKSGQWVGKERSNLKRPDGTYKWPNLIALFVNGLSNLLYNVILTYAWKFAKLGGINQGVISCLLSFASVFNVIVFYFAFKEKTSPA
jgi:drug/metabolite transporter (DMT)-like permease